MNKSPLQKKIWINGLSGRMGQELRTIIEISPQWHLVGGSGESELVNFDAKIAQKDWEQLAESLKNIDLLIDFSAPNANSKLYDAIELSKLQDKAVLIGTTGLSENQKKAWEQLAKARHLRLLQAPNTSLGVLLTLKISEQVARILDPLHFDIEVLETHHRAKIDAPSGTANFLAEGLAASIDKKTIYGRKGLRQTHEIGVASLRGGTVFGEHEVRFLGDHEEITISHRALSRKLFAQGALILAAWILAKEPGSWTLHDISIDEILDLLADKSPKP